MQHRFFEGSEKKFEVVVSSNAPDLRNLGERRWGEIAGASGAHVLSCMRTEHCDAYLLSESSLFVFAHKAVMITCGRTRLVDSVDELLRDVRGGDVELFMFERKNEVFPHLQPTSFYDDVSALTELIPGQALRFGHEDEHHVHLYHAGHATEIDPDDVTVELLMYDLDREAAALFEPCEHASERARTRSEVMQTMLPGYRTEEHVFEPSGYSLNGVRDTHYGTIHVTPQEHGSYASFETNHPLGNDVSDLCGKVLRVFRPRAFDLVLFDQGDRTFTPPAGYVPRARVARTLESGYRVRFLSHSIPPDEQRPFPIPIRTQATEQQTP